jgi:uncharacterized OB-fold protein
MTPPRPAPQPTDASQPFWDACSRRELRIQRCRKCGLLIHYPRLCCPSDGGDQFDWPQMSGEGKVHSYVVSRRAFHPAFADETPYVIAVIELEEGVRLLSNLVGVETEAVHIGMGVSLVWDETSGPYPLPKFRARAAKAGEGA